MKNEVYKKKLDEKGNPIIINGDYVSELVSSVDVKENPLTKDEINEMQKAEMSETDWYGTRWAIEKIEVPADVIAKRLAIIAKYDSMKNELIKK